MITPRRGIGPALVAVALGLAATPSLADTLAPSIGGLYAVAPGDQGGWGVEVTIDWLARDRALLPGVGALYQWEADGARQVGGLQVFEPGYGLELGLAHRRGRGLGLHVAPFASAAVVHVAPRITVPFEGRGVFEYGLVLALKLPAPIEI